MTDTRSGTDSPRLPSHVATPDIVTETTKLQSNGAIGPPKTNGVPANSTDALANKHLSVKELPARPSSGHSQASSLSGTIGQHRMLHESGSGYVAPTFEGKHQQMEKGKQMAGSVRGSHTDLQSQ